MQLPEKIVKMLSCGHPDTIQLGLYLALGFAKNAKEYHDYLWDLFNELEGEDGGTSKRADALDNICIWEDYFKENKRKFNYLKKQQNKKHEINN